MDILEEIVAHKRVELARQKEIVAESDLCNTVERELASGMRPPVSMSASLAGSSTGIIAEFKRKSPSKGWIHMEARVEDVVPQYEAAGASALSILTDSEYFGGDMRFVKKVRLHTTLPILRKDFIIDEYQLLQARLIGADAVLLIAACLDKPACRRLAQRAHELGLETLLETHTPGGTEYIDDNIDMVGVNNRNLGTFSVDVNNSMLMLPYLPTDRVLVSESGISNPETVMQLRSAGYRGFLIGETFMKTGNPGKALREFKQKLKGS